MKEPKRGKIETDKQRKCVKHRCGGVPLVKDTLGFFYCPNCGQSYPSEPQEQAGNHSGID